MKPMLLELKADLVTATLPFVLDPELQAGMRVLFRARDAMGVTALSFWVMRADFINANRSAVIDLLRTMCGRRDGSSTPQTAPRQSTLSPASPSSRRSELKLRIHHKRLLSQPRCAA